MRDVRGAVKEAEIEGRDAAELIWTYRNHHGDDQETVHRRKSFVYINADDVEWMLTVGMPAKGAHTAEGDQIYQYVVGSLEIHGL